MIKLITLDYAKQLLKIDTNDEDVILQALIAASSELVMKYLSSQAKNVIGLNDSGVVIDPSVVPERVKIATAMLVGYLKSNPDSDEAKAFEMGYLPKPVMSLLYMDRDPTLV